MKSKIVGFEHLHLHSDFSVLDGYGTADEYAKRAKEINQSFLCISDHGSLGAVPRQIQACEEYAESLYLLANFIVTHYSLN